MKDNFSTQADQYAQYRPNYPNDFFVYLNSILPQKHVAWDCGTGNGQVAIELAKTFEIVFATDCSAAQIAHAFYADNIVYSVQPAETTNFESNQFDLIVVAQAIHWFDFEKFYAEAMRTARPNAILCVLGYSRIKVNEEIDALITHFYTQIIGKYWDAERRYIDENYETIPFPFQEITVPKFINTLQWSKEQLIGYLNTWSAVKHFIKQNGYNPVEELAKEITPHWPDSTSKEVYFPLLLRIGKIRN